MRIFKTFIILYMCVLLMVTSVSCSSNDYSDKSIVFSTSYSVSTFDPQIVKTSAEITVATNSFEGLVTKNEKGEIVNGTAESYVVSDDKMTYTFKLRDDLVWSDGETPLTAKDYEFGIKRAVLPQTQSPYVSSLFSIKNAEAVNKGSKSIDTLGVSADVNKNTITIVLSKVDDGFLKTLALPMCFPCNEEYFYSTNGKYGLSNKYIISNGAYSINYYNQDTKTVIIQRNDDYKGDFEGIPKQITINYSEKYDDIYKAFESNETDMAEMECSYLKSLEELGKKSQLYYNTNYCLYLSRGLVSSTGSNLKKALCMDIDNGALQNNITDYYKPVSGIIPDINDIDGKNYRDFVGKVKILDYNKTEAEKLLGSFDAASERLNGVSLHYPSGESKLALVSGLIVQGWQKDLNVYINSQATDLQTILAGIKSGEIEIAVIPVLSESNSAIESLNSLNDLGIIKNVTGISAQKLAAQEQQLVDDGVIYPIISIPSAVVYSNEIDGFGASSDGKILDFRFIKMS